ncbi:MAG TPA: iron ABC transporter permease [Bacteroidota bacterium]|nr:iron ABC transporter permease [Bacteroidota bacterium]
MSSRSLTIVLSGLFLAAVFALFVLYPLGATVLESLKADGKFSLDHYRSLFDVSNSVNLEAVWNSVYVSILSVLLSGVVGLFLAFVFTQFRFPLRGLLSRIAVLPVALPPLVGVIAFLFVFGETGIIPRGLQLLAGAAEPVMPARGIAGVILVHVYSFNVYFYLFASAALGGLDASQLEAATGLGSGPWRTFFRVVVPELRPGILAASALTFMSSMASFTAPLLFAGGKHFITLQIYASKLNGEMDLAAAQSVLLTAVSLLFFLFLTLGPARRSAYARKGSASTGRMTTGSGSRRAMILAACAILGVEILPVAAIIALSLAQEGSWTTQWLPSAYTAANFISFVTDTSLLRPLLNSLEMALLAVAGSLAFGVTAAFLVAGTRNRFFGIWANVALTVPYAVPGTVVAVALILAFNRPAIAGVPALLVGTFWILPLAYFVREYPVILRAVGASLEGMDRSMLEAASGLGAGPVRAFRFVALPMLLPGILSGAVLVLIASLGEFVSSILLYTYDSRPVSVEILAQLRLFNIGSASAYSVLLMLVILVLLRLSGGLLASEGRMSYIL